MIDAIPATFVIIGFLLVWAIIIPICGAIPKIKDIISYRYLIVTVFLACMIGVIINFSDLDATARLVVIVSASILSVIYIIIRSIEKWLYNGWSIHRDVKLEAKKGDLSAKIEVNENDKNNAE